MLLAIATSFAMNQKIMTRSVISIQKMLIAFKNVDSMQSGFETPSAMLPKLPTQTFGA
jgi:hypothetical protein